MESALQYYGMSAEASNVVINSVSPKDTNEFTNRLGVFRYSKIKEEKFLNWLTINGEFPFIIAEPYKALFDYFYFRKIWPVKNAADLEELIEENRINTDNLSTEQYQLFKKLMLKKQ
jgi:hypothetical protein